MPNDTPTVQYRSSLLRVVIVHESPRPCIALADALRSRYVVRNAHDLGEIAEQVGVRDRLACVVCIAGRRLRARDVRDEVVRLGVAPERIVFLGLEELEPLDRALAAVRETIESFDPTTRLAS